MTCAPESCIARVAMSAPELAVGAAFGGLVFATLGLLAVWWTPMEMWTATTRDVVGMKEALIRRRGLMDGERPLTLWHQIRHGPPISWMYGII